ncbi:MAG: ADOP family duplicated permease [Gemmatimonadales bacterium]
MAKHHDSFSGRMDRLSVEQAARARGLPERLAVEVAAVVVRSALPDDRRAEVFEELVDHFQEGLAAGRSVEELLAAFGDGGRVAPLIREAKRSVTSVESGGSGPRDSFLGRMGRDVRYAVRRLIARPAFTAIAMLSLALGIGANAAMFTLVNDVILRRPPVEEPDRLLEVYYDHERSAFDPLSWPEMLDIERDAADVFEAVGGTRLTMAPRLDGDVPEQLMLELVSANFFQVLRVRPKLGRLLEPVDAPAPGTGDVVVLSHPYWQRAFGGDPQVLGQELSIGAARLRVIGVAPEDYPASFRGISIDAFVPMTMVEQVDRLNLGQLEDRSTHGTFVKARLRPGVTLEQARVSLARIATSLKEQRLGEWEGDDQFNLVPASEVILWPPLDKVLVPVAWMLMAVVGMVLVIACANLAAFLLARAIDRRKEVAVRLAMGASRGQLISQLLVETVLLSLAAGAVGLGLGRLALGLLMRADLPLPLPIHLDLALDWRVLAFATAVAVVAGVLFGLAPALQATRLDLATVIRDESTGGGRSKGRLRSVLVAGQVAVSVVLLVAAGLFVRSLGVLKGIDPGFGRLPAALVWIGLPSESSSTIVQATLDRIARRVVELPQVRSVGWIDNILLNTLGSSSTSAVVEGVEPPPGRDAWEIQRAAIDTGYLSVAGQTLIDGRNLTAADSDSGAPRVVLVNTAFAERFWPGTSAVGRRFRDAAGAEIEVVGVLNTAKARSLAEGPTPFVYEPLTPSRGPVVWMMAGVHDGADAALPAVLRAVREVEPDLFVIQSKTLARHIQVMSLPLELGATTLAGFAALALLMASIGLYGTVSYAVAQRSREVGIRLSLGADPRAVVRLLLWGGLRLVLAGAVVGVAIAAAGAGAVRGLLVGVAALDPLTFVTVPAVLLAVALLAAYLPARAAGRVDPTSALRGRD